MSGPAGAEGEAAEENAAVCVSARPRVKLGSSVRALRTTEVACRIYVTEWSVSEARFDLCTARFAFE